MNAWEWMGEPREELNGRTVTELITEDFEYEEAEAFIRNGHR